jgi:hypothetical protein
VTHTRGAGETAGSVVLRSYLSRAHPPAAPSLEQVRQLKGTDLELLSILAAILERGPDPGLWRAVLGRSGAVGR